MKTFGTYFHPETCMTIKPMNEIEFIGQSLDYYEEVRAGIRKELRVPELPLNRVEFDEFKSVHGKEYLDAIKAFAGGDEQADLTISAECFNLPLALPGFEYGLGGLYSAVDLMKRGVLDRAYCFTQPSHHSFPSSGHGYCLLNSMAAAALYAQKSGFRKILIIDWDFHHGDGTQTIFENDSSVYIIEIHSAIDLYMSMVKSIELGTTVYSSSVGHCSIPVLDENYTDEFFHDELGLKGDVFRAENVMMQFRLALENLPFTPDMIFVFDGHDGHTLDCGKYVTKFEYEDFAMMTRAVIEISNKYNAPVISLPGGGYELDITVNSAAAHMSELFLS